MPTLLIVGAVLLGILLGLIAALLSAVTAASRRRRTRRRLVTETDKVVERLVVDRVAAELERARTFASARAIASA